MTARKARRARSRLAAAPPTQPPTDCDPRADEMRMRAGVRPEAGGWPVAPSHPPASTAQRTVYTYFSSSTPSRVCGFAHEPRRGVRQNDTT